MKVEEKYMMRCIQLAKNGFPRTVPNPMVGAVIVHNDRIIGEGYHICCGGPHAEVNAVRSVAQPELLKDCTLYVSLEPCSHYGKTPPCAELIVSSGIPRVVVGSLDPFPQVAGRGIRRLREAGIEVVTGVCEAECKELNKCFMTFHTRRRPFVTLKWAQSADGFIDTLRGSAADGAQTVFSTPFTQMVVHKRRAEHQAILVGRGTAVLDNPSLSVRCWTGRSPLRLVIDSGGVLPVGLRLFDGEPETRVYVGADATPGYADRDGVTCVRLEPGRNVLSQVMDDLYTQNVQTLLVEGGSRLLQGFFETGLWDEAYVELADGCIGQGVPAPLPVGACRTGSRFYMGRQVVCYRRTDGGALCRMYP